MSKAQLGNMYIYIYIYIYMHHSDNRPIPIDQQGLGWPKVVDKIIDQQGAGCRGKPAQSEDAKLKAQLEIHTDLPAC